MEKGNQRFKLFEIYRDAFLIVWVCISIIFIGILLATFLLDAEFVLAAMPECTARKSGGSCAFCGNSRAFFELGGFNFKNAYMLNKGSIFLWFMMIINSIFFFRYSYYYFFSHPNPNLK
jgi:hypothetical protein